MLAQDVKAPLVGKVKYSEGGEPGCGFFKEGDNTGDVLLDFGREEGAWVNIDGKDIKLENISPQEEIGSVWKYKANNITVTLKLKMTSKMEYQIKYKGQMRVIRDGKQTVLAIVGECGC